MSKNKDLYRVSTEMPPLPELEGKSALSFFDQDNNDINLFNLVDDELIRISGSELLYYKFYRSAGWRRNQTKVPEPEV
mgnify:CR=1 FL=1